MPVILNVKPHFTLKKTITLQTAKVYHCLRLEWLSGRCWSEFEDHITLVIYVQNFVTSKKDIEIV